MLCGGRNIRYSAPDRQAEYCDERVCLFVCVFVRDHIFGTTRPIFTKIFVHVTYGRGSISYVLLVIRMTSYLLISQGCSAPQPI